MRTVCFVVCGRRAYGGFVQVSLYMLFSRMIVVLRQILCIFMNGACERGRPWI